MWRKLAGLKSISAPIINIARTWQLILGDAATMGDDDDDDVTVGSCDQEMMSLSSINIAMDSIDSTTFKWPLEI